MLLDAYTASFRQKGSIDLNDLAAVLNHSTTRSGSLLLKVTSMKSYGMLTRWGKIYITEIGAALAYPKNREEEEALQKAVKNIPLWRELYNRYGVNLPGRTLQRSLLR